MILSAGMLRRRTAEMFELRGTWEEEEEERDSRFDE